MRIYKSLFAEMSLRFVLVSTLFLISSCSPTLYAQTFVQKLEIQGIAGLAAFPDEGWINHAVVGAAITLPLSRRWAVEPEFLYLYSSEHDMDIHLIPNLLFQWKNRSRIVPYLKFGVGLERHRSAYDQWVSWASSWTGGCGFGTRIFLSDHWYVSPEFRLGWEPLLRVTGSVGYSFGGRSR